VSFREKRREKEMNMLTTKSFSFALVLVLALSLAAAGAVGAIPQAPHIFWGEVTINGSPAPDGTTVSAHIGSLSWSTTTSGGSYGYAPTFTVAADDPETPEKEGGIEGDVIVFKVNGMLAANCFFKVDGETGLDLAVQTCTLTMAVSGSGITNPAVGVHTYAPSTFVAITAIPAAGWFFDSWSGNLSGSDNPDTIIMDSNKSITANFAEIPPAHYTLIMSVSGSGSTNPAVGVHTYAPGTIVEIRANPAAGWFFDSWSGDVGDVADPESATTTVTMDSDKTVTANFAVIAPPTTVGGSAHPPNKVAVLAPWIGLGVVLAGSMSWLVLRRLRLSG
jgi:hypothetical protein